MVIDDSTARASIRKQVTIFNRRLSSYTTDITNWKSRKSRKRWIKNYRALIQNTSWIIDSAEDRKKIIQLFVLVPDNKKFHTSVITMDIKKLRFSVNKLGINFTDHFLIRLMQYRKTMNLKDLTQDINQLLDSLFALLEHLEQDSKKDISGDDYGLYIDEFGFVPVVCNNKDDNFEMIVKTVIPPQSMGYKHREKYLEIKDSGQMAIERQSNGKYQYH